MRVFERLFAYRDDWFPSRDGVGDLHNSAERELKEGKDQDPSGKTHVWNRSGRKPPVCDELQRRAEMLDEEVRVWTLSEILSIQQGIKVLGFPLGHVDFVRAPLEATTAKHSGARHPVSKVVVAPLRFGTSKLPTQGFET